MGTNCAPLVACLFLFCYENYFMLSLFWDQETELIETFNSTPKYLNDLLTTDNICFDGIVNQIYPSEFQLNKTIPDTSDTVVPFLDLHLTISDGFVSSNVYDKRDDFDFDVVNVPFLHGK